MRLILNLFNNIYNNKKSLIFSIFLISILCSLVFLFLFRNIGPPEHRLPTSDYLAYYEPITDSLLQGRGIPFEREFFINIPPGYPILLSVIFTLSQLTGIDKLDLIVGFNIIFTAISSCFLFLIAKEIFNKKIALIASLLWMSYPFNFWFVKNTHTEVPFILLFYTGLWLFISALKKRNLGFVFFGGLILGLASLTRWISLFLPLPLALLVFFFLKQDSKKRQFLLAIFFLIGAFLPFFLWETFLLSETGGFLPLFNIGPDNITYGFTSLAESADSEKGVYADDIRESLERVEEFRRLNRGVNAFYFLIQEVSKRPLAFLQLIGLKIVRVWYATSKMWWERKILAIQILYLVPGFLGVLFGIKRAKGRIREIIFLLVVIFYFWGMTFLSISILRYMVPVMGLVIIFSALTVNVIIDRLVKKIRSPL